MDKREKKSVLIGIPNVSGWGHEHIACSRMAMIEHTKETLPDVAIHFTLVTPHDISQGRWDLAKDAVENEFDYLFFLDSDTIVPKFALTRLLQMQTDICSGLAFTNDVEMPLPSIYVRLEESERGKCGKNYAAILLYLTAKSAILELDGIGLYACLIKTDVFNKIAEHNDSMIDWFNPFKSDGIGEDFAFCKHAQAAGFKIYVDAQIKCGHFPRWPQIIDELMFLEKVARGVYGEEVRDKLSAYLKEK